MWQLTWAGIGVKWPKDVLEPHQSSRTLRLVSLSVATSVSVWLLDERILDKLIFWEREKHCATLFLT